MIALQRAYNGTSEHLLAEMKWLGFLIERQVLLSRGAREREQPDPFKSLYISDSEIERLVGGGGADAVDDSDTKLLLEQAAAAKQEASAIKKASLDRSVFLPLARLAHVFALSEFEENVVLLALAVELDLKYERLFAWLQDDIARKRPSIDLALRLFCVTPEEKLAARAAFSVDAPLFRARILRPLDRTDSPLLARPLALDDSVLAFLLGSGATDLNYSACARLFETSTSVEELLLPETLRRQLFRLVRKRPQKLVLNLIGPPGAGRKTLACRLGREIGAPLLVIDLQELVQQFDNFEEALRTLLRRGLLHQQAVCLENTASLSGDDEKSALLRNALRRAAADLAWLLFVVAEKPWSAAELFSGQTFLTIDVPGPGIPAREKLWSAFAGSQLNRFDERISWEDIAAKFRLTAGQIEAALAHARHRALLRGKEALINEEDIHQGCYSQSNRRLASLARRLPPRHGWQNLTLPAGALAQLREICSQVRHRRRVYGDWGFDATLSLSKGLAVLFYGQSGVGKTMAVEVIANELKLELFKIDLSTVVSKYIGETEKNLSRIFHEAESSNAILFFDEADALFGKRSEVKDAHDRYANIEINYLLQRMEEFDGLAVLATNLRKNIDEGFFRRMHFAIEFPFPDSMHRYRIWKQHLPEAAPVASDVDFDYLAERFHLTGGNIRNVVVNAAFLAAEEAKKIGMEHLIRATRREYEKIGRVCTENDFKPYQQWLDEVRIAS